MKEILYILLDNYAEHEIGFMPGAVSTDATGFRKEPWGQRTCYVADPDGNLIEIGSFSK
jgi:catechol 2,3-dioxygenase-like lactoylglutathione lyase family enzyme